MFSKISDELEESWSLKKKVQISWKINKNIIHKAIGMGIKPPKIEKSSVLETTYLTIPNQKSKPSQN